MNYEMYKESRDLTWNLLIKHQINKLPIKSSKICESNEIALFSYEQGKEMLEKLDLIHKTINNDGFTITLRGESTFFIIAIAQSGGVDLPRRTSLDISF